jgi:hypothetical protein
MNENTAHVQPRGDANQRPAEADVVAADKDFPEHLDTSSMCPANPKHVSGRKGVCPDHGRKSEPEGQG